MKYFGNSLDIELRNQRRNTNKVKTILWRNPLKGKTKCVARSLSFLLFHNWSLDEATISLFRHNSWTFDMFHHTFVISLSHNNSLSITLILIVPGQSWWPATRKIAFKKKDVSRGEAGWGDMPWTKWQSGTTWVTPELWSAGIRWTRLWYFHGWKKWFKSPVEDSFAYVLNIANNGVCMHPHTGPSATDYPECNDQREQP